MTGPGHPQPLHVGCAVTVGVFLGQHRVGQPTGTVTVGALASSGQTWSAQTKIGHPMKPGFLTVTVGQAGAMMVVRLVVVLVVRGQIRGRSGETVTSASETAPSIWL